MNIDDVKVVDCPSDDRVWPAIFLRQAELAEKYSPIERRNGFYYPDVVLRSENDVCLISAPKIDDAVFQNWLKGMFWRVTEEVAEALENPVDSEVLRTWRNHFDTDTDLRHMLEELADALHFLVEVSISVGFSGRDICAIWDTLPVMSDGASVRELCMDMIVSMGLCANTLKNKPWKNTQMPTDFGRFLGSLRVVWVSMVHLWRDGLGFKPVEVYTLYTKKACVNAFRQRTNY